MAEEIARLVAVLEANVSKFTKGMADAERIADQRFGAIEKRMRQTESTFSKGFSGIGSQLTRFLSVTAVLAFAKGLLDTADALQDTAAQLGVTTQELQGLDAAARSTGAGQDKLRAALAFLTDSLGDAAKGEGNLAKVMRELNIPLGTNIQVLFDVADATAKAATQNDKMRIATAAFGKAGRDLVPLLDQSADGIRRMLDEAQKKGQIWDQETIDKLGKAHDAFEALRVSLTGKLANPFADVLDGVRQLIESTTSADFIKALANIDHATQVFPKGTFPLLKGVGANNILNRENASQPAPAQVAAAQAAANVPVPTQKPGARTPVPVEAAEIKRRIKDLADAQIKADAAVADKLEEHLQRRKDFQEFLNEAPGRLAASTREGLAGQIGDLTDADANKINTIVQGLHAADKRAQEFHDTLRTRVIGDFAELGAAALTGADNFGDAIKRMLTGIAQLIIQLEITKALESSIGTGGSGGILSGIGKVLGFAGGGSVSGGRPIIVGERGPEMFVPNSNGKIIPNNKLSGGNPIVLNVDARGAQEGVAQQLATILPAVVARAVKESDRRFAGNLDLTMRDKR